MAVNGQLLRSVQTAVKSRSRWDICPPCVAAVLHKVMRAKSIQVARDVPIKLNSSPFELLSHVILLLMEWAVLELGNR